MTSIRPKIQKEVQREILVRCRRRCCLCYGLKGNFEERIGQIAHIDQNPSNNNLDNLAWLCFDHHSLLDSTTRQHKNYQPDELKTYRDRLCRAIATSAVFGPESLGEYITTENSSHVIRLQDRIIVIFDRPMRCTPSLHFYPNDLINNGDPTVDQWTKRGFQLVFKNSSIPANFAFFADASSKEYKAEAELEKYDWKETVGFDTNS